VISTGKDLLLEFKNVLIFLIPKNFKCYDRTKPPSFRNTRSPGVFSIVTASLRFLILDHRMAEAGIQNSFENETAMHSLLSEPKFSR
jgi:hypothetical protein